MIPGLSANGGHSNERIEHDRLIRVALLDIEALPYESLLVLFFPPQWGKFLNSCGFLLLFRG